MIDLEFDTASQAETLLAAMRVVWGRVEGKIMMNPQTRIVGHNRRFTIAPAAPDNFHLAVPRGLSLDSASVSFFTTHHAAHSTELRDRWSDVAHGCVQNT